MLQLFTDTSANLPVALTKQHHITVVPFSYTVDGKETDYPDDVDFDGAAFYGAMRRGAVVKTSMVNPDLMANYFERALSQGDDVLYVGMSGGISGTAQAAVIGRADGKIPRAEDRHDRHLRCLPWRGVTGARSRAHDRRGEEPR